MGYESLIRDAIANIASPQFESMKLDVVHTPWIGDDGQGNDVFGSPQTLRALVDLSQRQRYTSQGVLVMTFAVLTFLDAIPTTTPNTGFIRQGPLDLRDSIVLPGGGTAPVVQAGGFADSGTNLPFVTDTILGSVVRGQ
jgi:hypothetical protein